MNDTTHHHVIDRIESLADGASARVQTPPFDAERHRLVGPPAHPPRPQRRRRLVAAAVVTSFVASGAALALRDGDDARSIQTAANDPTEQIDAVVPTQWPAGVDGEITAHVDPATLGPPEMDDRVASAVLELNGRAAAAVSTTEQPLESMTFTGPDAPTPEQVTGTLDRRPTIWRDRPDGSLVGFIEVAENRTTVIASRTIDRSGLEPLASAIAAADGVPAAATLPPGWTSTEPELDLADVFMSAMPGSEWSTVSGRSSDSSKHMSVSTVSTVDTDAQRERVREFAGPTGQRIDVGSDGDAVLMPFAQTSGDEGYAVAWVPSPGLLSVAVGWGIEADEVVATARSAGRPTRGQWDSLLPVVDRTATTPVDGFRIPATATTIDSGQLGDLRWMLVLDRPVIPEEFKDDLAAETYGLILLDGEGRQGEITTWGRASEFDTMGSKAGPHYMLGALLPKGSTDISFERNGEPLTLGHVVLPDGDRDLHFTVVPAVDAAPNNTALITATLPDGTPFVRMR
jgi:hypothetical protein